MSCAFNELYFLSPCGWAETSHKHLTASYYCTQGISPDVRQKWNYDHISKAHIIVSVTIRLESGC